MAPLTLSCVLPFVVPIALRTHMFLSQDLWWQGHFVQKSGAFTHCSPGHYRGRVVYHAFLRAGTLLRIRVSNWHQNLEV